MSAPRRLDKLETSLTPAQLVIRWLDEAHAHSSFVAYSRSLVDAEAEQYPLTRLCGEAGRTALYGTRNRRGEAAAKAIRETLFRFLLVLRINVTAYEQSERDTLFHAALAAHFALLTGTPPRKRDGAHRARVSKMCGLLFDHLREMQAWASARARAEERYLDGRASLFSDVATASEQQLEAMRQSGALALQLAELDGADVRIEQPSEDQVDAFVADLVEPSKAIALEKLGDGERGLPIAVRWLRSKYERTEASDTGDPALDLRTL